MPQIFKILLQTGDINTFLSGDVISSIYFQISFSSKKHAQWNLGLQQKKFITRNVKSEMDLFTQITQLLSSPKPGEDSHRDRLSLNLWVMIH